MTTIHPEGLREPAGSRAQIEEALPGPSGDHRVRALERLRGAEEHRRPFAVPPVTAFMQ